MPILPIIETACGLDTVATLLAHPTVPLCAFGHLDFSLDIGAAPTWENLLFARSQLVLQSRLAGVAQPLDGVTVIHRVGRLLPQENIVFVGCASAHRQAAFEAAHYIMDYLKTKAPFWKKEDRESGASWVDARETDYTALQRWDE